MKGWVWRRQSGGGSHGGHQGDLLFRFPSSLSHMGSNAAEDRPSLFTRPGQLPQSTRGSWIKLTVSGNTYGRVHRRLRGSSKCRLTTDGFGTSVTRGLPAVWGKPYQTMAVPFLLVYDTCTVHTFMCVCVPGCTQRPETNIAYLPLRSLHSFWDRLSLNPGFTNLSRWADQWAWDLSVCNLLILGLQSSIAIPGFFF